MAAFFCCQRNRPDALEAFNAIFRKACYEYFVSLNLARHFHSAGLKDIRTQAFLAHTDNLDAHPFWCAFIVHQMPMFIHVELIGEATAQAFLADLEEINSKGDFSANSSCRRRSARNRLKPAPYALILTQGRDRPGNPGQKGKP